MYSGFSRKSGPVKPAAVRKHFGEASEAIKTNARAAIESRRAARNPVPFRSSGGRSKSAARDSAIATRRATAIESSRNTGPEKPSREAKRLDVAARKLRAATEAGSIGRLRSARLDYLKAAHAARTSRA